MAKRISALLFLPSFIVGCSAATVAPTDGSSAGASSFGGAFGSLGGSATNATGGSSTSGGANASGGISGNSQSGAAAGGSAAGAGTSGRGGMGGAGGASGGGSGTSGAAGQGAGGGMSGAGAGGGTSGGACAAPSMSTATRPQLTSTQAQSYTIQKYLAQSGPFTALVTDNWDPTGGLGSASAFKPDFTVAADGSGTHTTLQAAFNAVTGTARRYILVKPVAGGYRGQVSYLGATPVTLYGASSDATQVVIVNNLSQASGASQTFAVKSNGFQLVNLTVSNDFATPKTGDNLQAVALQTNGDKIVLQNVRLHGFQDTLQLQAPSATSIGRVYVKDSFIEGDTDFIYGNATVVLDNTEVHYLASRRGTSSGVVMAPSTSVGNALGFLFIRCNFTAEAGAPANKISLGRSWDTSSTTPTPNGQGVIRESTLGVQVNRTKPWAAAATSNRAYSASGNRFDEYCNSGPGAAP